MIIIAYSVVIVTAISSYALADSTETPAITLTNKALADNVLVAPQSSLVSDARLPAAFTPQAYKIKVRPYLLESDAERRFTFDGEVYINVTRVIAARELVLHSKRLNYTLSEYWSTKLPDKKLPLPNPVSDPVTDKMTFNFLDPLDVNTIYTLHFKYTGYMDDDMNGFYRSSYINGLNETKWLGSTQFEPIYARRVFPSFDEPKFKAKFIVSIVRHKSMNAHSNTRIQMTKAIDNDYYIDTFLQTPRMSTYLLAFLVSEFTERINGNIGVIARPELYDQTEYSATFGKKALHEFDKYLNLPYYEQGPDVLRMAAIPDFSPGAMENWGLLTYREKSLLYDPTSSTLRSKQKIANTVAHEQAHMWFGNLVTCEWWSYLWLNEGFARYFEYHMSAKVEKGFNMEQQFVVDELQNVMLLDSTNETNPLSNENLDIVNDSKRIFNSITYSKGGSFIRMIRFIIGEKNFQESLQDYLKTYKYRNTVPADLLEIWEQYWPASSVDQAALVFKSYTEQAGFPVVTVDVADDGKSINIKQKRYLSQPNDGSDATLLYTIPFTYTTNVEKDFNSAEPKLYLAASKATTTEKFAQPVEWVIANIQASGYYRVNYDNKNWDQIQRALLSPNWGGIHELNRAQIVDDLFQLAQTKDIEYDRALNILEYLGTELNYLPWNAALRGFSYLANRLSKDITDFGIYIRQELEKAYNQLGFEEKSNDTAFEIFNRNQILAWSCKYGNTQCIAEAKKIFSTLNSKPVPANFRQVVYCTAMREGNETDFNILFNKLKAETVQTEVVLILDSLGCVKDKNLIEKYYNIIFSETVRRQDKMSTVRSLISGNHENYITVFDLVLRDFEKIAEDMEGYSDVAGVINYIAARITEEKEEKMLRQFIAAKKSKFGAATVKLEAAEATVAQNIAWYRDNLEAVKLYFEKRAKGSGNVISSFKVLTIALVPLLSLIIR